jgi:hypothetical protein
MAKQPATNLTHTSEALSEKREGMKKANVMRKINSKRRQERSKKEVRNKLQRKLLTQVEREWMRRAHKSINYKT